MSDHELKEWSVVHAVLLRAKNRKMWRLAATGWLLVGATVPPEPGAPEVGNRCGYCESALARAALTRPLALDGIHCGHCGRVSRAKWVDGQEGG